MKSFSGCIRIAWVLAALCARGQGTLVYDQGFDTEPYAGRGGIGVGGSNGQSFTPSFSSVGFIRLVFYGGFDYESSTFITSTFIVNLRTDSINGPILASTEPVILSGLFGYFTNFFFATPVPLTPGETYYFQPVDLSGSGLWGVRAMLSPDPDYPGGTAFINGNAATGKDMWFREGIVVVPEPSSALLLLLGGGVLLYVRRARHR